MPRFTLPWRRNRAPRNPVLHQVGTAFENGPGDDNVDWPARLIYFGFMSTLTLGGLASWVVYGPIQGVIKLRTSWRRRHNQQKSDQHDS